MSASIPPSPADVPGRPPKPSAENVTPAERARRDRILEEIPDEFWRRNDRPSNEPGFTLEEVLESARAAWERGRRERP